MAMPALAPPLIPLLLVSLEEDASLESAATAVGTEVTTLSEVAAVVLAVESSAGCWAAALALA